MSRTIEVEILDGPANQISFRPTLFGNNIRSERLQKLCRRILIRELRAMYADGQIKITDFGWPEDYLEK